MKSMTLVFKGGAVVTVDCIDVTTEWSKATSELTRLNWTTADKWKTKLMTANVNEIAAVIVND